MGLVWTVVVSSTGSPKDEATVSGLLSSPSCTTGALKTTSTSVQPGVLNL